MTYMLDEYEKKYSPSEMTNKKLLCAAVGFLMWTIGVVIKIFLNETFLLLELMKGILVITGFPFIVMGLGLLFIEKLGPVVKSLLCNSD
jgi:hypothetical protein